MGTFNAATGPNGQVFEIKPDGSHTELFKVRGQRHQLLSDGKDICIWEPIRMGW